MSKKIQNLFVCSKCGAQFPKWSGRCSECGSWSTLHEEAVMGESEAKKIANAVPAAEIIDLAKISKTEKYERMKTGISEVDRVFGGGIVPGSLIILSGEPGIGKSTILAQIADAVGKKSPKNPKALNDPKNPIANRVAYASGEESAPQVCDRLERLGCQLENIDFLSETNVEKIISAAKKSKPVLLIVDSIQTVYSMAAESEPGSVTQIRASAVKFLEFAKENNVAVILVGHITKDGQIAGPKTLEHLVDTVIYLEADTAHDYRVLRATKNRFGSINELGIFEMRASGFVEIKNPSSIFVDLDTEMTSGAVMSSVMEGTRPFLLEVQALATKTVFGYPQRKSSGFDLNRLQVLTAVLIKRAGVNLTNQDVILNIAGGMKANDPGLDLAVCYSIISSLLNQKVDRRTIVLGEVGLGGEVRKISKIKDRLEEAAKLGFNMAIVPEMDLKVDGMELVKLKNLGEIVKKFF